MTDPETPAGVGRPPTVLRAACILLLILGFGSAAISFSTAIDAESARCRLARDRIDSANTDTKPWNNVDTAGRKPKDLPCADAIRLVPQIRLNEKGTRTENVPSETAVRVQSLFGVIIGVGQALSASFVLRTLGKIPRNAAIAFSAFSLVIPVLGFISFGVAIFALYALVMSPPAKQLWGKSAA
jgi:hypothetical protein